MFWQFRHGESDFGITLHRMTSEYDSGNIVAQKKILLSDGVSVHEATKNLAKIGSQLILKFLDDLEKNMVNEVAQNNNLSSLQPFPTIADYRVETSWTAKRIHDFINAYKAPTVFFLCEIDRHEYQLVEALSYQDNAYENLADKEYKIEGDLITFVCENSYIQCKIKDA